MSIERELLVEALGWMEELKYVYADSLNSGDRLALELRADINKIELLLTQPEQTEQEQEPVAWIIETEIYGKLSEWVCTDKKHYLEAHDSIKEPIPLYTAPPKREPLSDKEITKNTPKLIHIGERLAFHAGVRFAEKHHGIGGGEC